jgi:hypothetical protein
MATSLRYKRSGAAIKENARIMKYKAIENARKRMTELKDGRY